MICKKIFLLVFDGSDMFSSCLYREEKKDTSHVYNFDVVYRIIYYLTSSSYHIIIQPYHIILYHNSFISISPQYSLTWMSVEKM